MFNDDYEEETEETSESNDGSLGGNLKLVIIIAVVLVIFIILLLVINSVTKSKKQSVQPQQTTSPVEIIDKDGEDEGEDENENIVEDRRVGSSTYGYITVPSTWEDYQDESTNSSLQYSDGNYIITLKAVLTTESDALTYATAVKKKFVNDGVDTTGATVSLGKYKAYQVYGYYTSAGKWCVCWIFEAEDGKTHFISAEGPQKDRTAFKTIPESFSLEK